MLPSLCNSFLTRNIFVRTILNNIKLTLGIFIALFRGTPGLVGVKRLKYHLIYLIKKYNKEIFVKNNVIYIENRKHSKINPSLRAFLPIEGFSLRPEDVNNIQEILKKKLYNNNPEVIQKYFKATALYWASFSLVLFANIMIIITFIKSAYYLGYGQILATVFWIMANIFLAVQMYIFHKTRLRSIALENNIVEATNEEEEQLLLGKTTPGSLILVPAYKEEVELLRRSLLSHMLQKYTNKGIVLLLGNEYYTDDDNTLKNTREAKVIVKNLNLEFQNKQDEVEELLRTPDRELLSSLKKIYCDISQWLSEKAEEISSSDIKYPTDNYLVEECLLKLKDFYTQRCNTIETLNSSELKTEAEYCRKIFSVQINVFMRTKYPNLEQEKTKAGNLTAYLPFINRAQLEKSGDEPDKMILIPGEENNKFKYISIFDCDTIPKPGYLLRKIIYLEKDCNKEIGLIQSPYIVPDPEPSKTGSASGVHSFWFLPISIGLTSYGSSFWLGFNSCWRFDTLKQIPDFMAETIIEDVEVSLKVLETGYKIVTSPEQQCITYSPTDLKGVRIQRTRWASGGFRIIKIFAKILKQKRYNVTGSKEYFLRMNYIVNLNILPIFMSLLFIIKSPLHYHTIPYMTLQFLSYLWIFFAVSFMNTKYKALSLIDGLCISFFMNFYYLRGVAQSLKVLFKPDKNQVFNSTPRVAEKTNNTKSEGKKTTGNKKYLIDTFEVLAVLFLLFIFIRALIFNITMGYYSDLFPVYQILCVIYCVGRFIGFRHFMQSAINHLIVRPFSIFNFSRKKVD